MSFTLRQVQPLLTKAELELFQDSRATAVRTLNERQLASRIKRARALRDKHRDAYRRQTVKTRATARPSTGDENRRTELKAEIMADVLQRFEAQQLKLQAQVARQAAAAKKPATAGKPAAARKPAVAKTTAVARKATATTKPAAVKTPAAKKLAAAQVAAKKPAAKKATVAKPTAKKPAAASATGSPGARVGIKARVSGTASGVAQGAVSTRTTAKAQRGNPLKAKPVNKKIHASARSRQKVHTAKRDAR